MDFDSLRTVWSDAGWLVVVLLFAVLLVWEMVKKSVPAGAGWLLRRLYRALAGTRLVRRRALRTYRQRVAGNYSRLPVPFAATAKMDVGTVYVPLRTVGEVEGGDAYGRIRSTDHAVVVGPPGSGKSMLLRHSILSWARRDSGRGRVPVLVELFHCNGNAKTPDELIVAQFDIDGFPRAERFVERALRDGHLSVLFDGLDEVSTAERPRVVQMLRDFAHAYGKCQIVVTCRSAIYDRQLAPEITTVFQVAEFDERLIRRFLLQWPTIRTDTAVERLMAALRDTPRLRQLAGNPLLLTMIAYLYGEQSGKDGPAGERRVLPHSRAEFYKEAVSELLSGLKDAANQFRGPAKHAILKRLALVAQDMPAERADRRALPYEMVIGEIRGQLPNLGLPDSAADDVLQEIVHRSGLLLAVDRGVRYQFAHLTLQEFLAAEVFEDDAEGLLGRYRDAPEDWRESVRLWCGMVSRDSGPVIGEVFTLDPVLALQCLSDAQVVNEDVAEKVMSWAKDCIQDPDGDGLDAVIAAFGSVAADGRPRGRLAFQFLHDQTRDPEGSAYWTACQALVATNLPEAAAVLAPLATTEELPLRALAGMGDLAVPTLAEMADREGNVVAAEALGLIGTPAAAQALAAVLWRDEDVAYNAAWHLARLITAPEVERALAEVEVDPSAISSHQVYLWVWTPFRDPAHPGFERIAGRIAYLLDRSPATTIPEKRDRLDPRLTLPLLAVRLSAAFPVADEGLALPEDVQKLVADLLGGTVYHRFTVGDVTPLTKLSVVAHLLRGVGEGGETIVQPLDHIVRAWVAGYDWPPRATAMFEALEPQVRCDLFARLVNAPEIRVRQRDWSQVRSPKDPYTYKGSREYLTVMGIVAVLCGVAAVRGIAMVFGFWEWGPGWLQVATAIYATLATALVVSVARSDPERLFLVLGVSLFLPYAVRNVLDNVFAFLLLLAVALAAPWIPVVGLTVAVTGTQLLTVWGAAGLLALLGVVAWLCARTGRKHERSARNPLRGLLELADVAARSRSSIIS